MVRTGQVAAEQSDSRIWNHILWLVEASRNKRSIYGLGEPNEPLDSIREAKSLGRVLSTR